MSDISVKTAFTERMADLTYILQYTVDPVIRTTFPEYGNRHRLFGGAIPISTQPIEAKGLVRRFQTSVPDDAVNLGIIGNTTAWPGSWSQPTFTNLRVTTQHLSDMAVKVRFDKRAAQLVKDNAIGNAAAFLARQAARMLARKVDVLTIANRQAVLGTIVAAPGTTTANVTDDTTNSRFVFQLEIGPDVIMTAFQPGALLQVCPAPANHCTAIATTRQGIAPLTVLGDPKVGATANGGYYTVTIGVPYTSGNKDDLWATGGSATGYLTTIAATDVITPWAGASTTTSLPALGGANHGLCGLLHHTQASFSSGIPTFANIESVTGAVTAALTTDEDSPRSVNRNSVEFAFLNPLVYDAGGTSIGNHLSLLDSIFLNLGIRYGEVVDRVVLVNPLIHQAIRAAVGTNNFRFMDDPTKIESVLKVKYGTTGFIYQGESATPILVGKHAGLPPNMVLVSPSEGGLEYLSPEPPEWEKGGIGGMWERAHNSSGDALFALEACRHQTLQVFPKADTSPREWGAIVNTKP